MAQPAVYKEGVLSVKDHKDKWIDANVRRSRDETLFTLLQVLLSDDTITISPLEGKKEVESPIKLFEGIDVSKRERKKKEDPIAAISSPTKKMKDFYFRCPSEEDLDKWIAAFQKSALLLSPTVFGVDLTFLVKKEAFQKGINSLIPTIIPQYIQYLDNYRETDGIFRESASKDQEKALRGLIDAGEHPDLNSYNNPHLIANQLKLILRELPEPLLTFDKYTEFVRAARNENEEAASHDIKKLVDTLPPVHQATLAYIMKFLKTVADKQEKNRMTPTNLSVCFGPTILKPREENFTTMGNNELVNTAAKIMISYSSIVFSSTIMTPARATSGVYNASSLSYSAGSSLSHSGGSSQPNRTVTPVQPVAMVPPPVTTFQAPPTLPQPVRQPPPVVHAPPSLPPPVFQAPPPVFQAPPPVFHAPPTLPQPVKQTIVMQAPPPTLPPPSVQPPPPLTSSFNPPVVRKMSGGTAAPPQVGAGRGLGNIVQGIAAVELKPAKPTLEGLPMPARPHSALSSHSAGSVSLPQPPTRLSLGSGAPITTGTPMTAAPPLPSPSVLAIPPPVAFVSSPVITRNQAPPVNAASHLPPPAFAPPPTFAPPPAAVTLPPPVTAIPPAMMSPPPLHTPPPILSPPPALATPPPLSMHSHPAPAAVFTPPTAFAAPPPSLVAPPPLSNMGPPAALVPPPAVDPSTTTRRLSVKLEETLKLSPRVGQKNSGSFTHTPPPAFAPPPAAPNNTAPPSNTAPKVTKAAVRPTSGNFSRPEISKNSPMAQSMSAIPTGPKVTPPAGLAAALGRGAGSPVAPRLSETGRSPSVNEMERSPNTSKLQQFSPKSSSETTPITTPTTARKSIMQTRGDFVSGLESALKMGPRPGASPETGKKN
ncbi:hypothetical protein PROFUN_00826 [Planoprotostelium fungivorum]|uniref:Uncharacterized protein n=1 Tax=Planoprotostelium fungivorum TaxID=1890364 RepID=A0A2P6P034_9EUKA|nr:hypothetical protein PROFUN_00826 [Planoprotostelium fungivorum]